VGSDTQIVDVAGRRHRRLPALARLRDIALGRVAPATFFSLVLAFRAPHIWATLAATGGGGASPADLLGAATAALLLAYFALLIVLYVIRLAPRAADNRPGVVAAAFASTFLVVLVPYLPAAPRRDWLLLPADLLSVAGMVYVVWALLSLRRSFAILPQARKLVTRGPYGLSRHPLYLGEMVGIWSLYLPTLAWPAVLAFAANVVLLVVRIRAEERLLATTFGREHEEYRRRVPGFVPRVRRRRPASSSPQPTT
jgi:protein-S-isoprenylcysteine O-methyltransferase Ste14